MGTLGRPEIGSELPPVAESLPVTSPAPASEPPTMLEYPATYLLIGVNVAVFALMTALARIGASGREASVIHTTSGLAGAGRWLGDLLSSPFSPELLARFGSCNPDRVLLEAQWWRLVTSLFVHVTPLHLLLNMWCLWNLGLFGERLLGRAGLIAVYLLTGVTGMMQSVLVNLLGGELHVAVAGASGAIFGIAGILIVLLSNRRLSAPWRELRSLRRQVIFFALSNLLLGALPGYGPRLLPGLFARLGMGSLPIVDNGAHLGGFVSGLALGLPLVPRMTSGRSSYRVRQRLVFSVAGLVLVLAGFALAGFARSLVR